MSLRFNAKTVVWYTLLVSLVFVCLAGLRYRHYLYEQNLRAAQQPLSHQLNLAPTDRLMVVAPHCDDESLGCGGLLARASRLRLPVEVVIVTNGDGFRYAAELDIKRLKVKPVDYIRFAQRRQQESLAALQSLGVPPGAVTFLGYPDRGTEVMWYTHWRASGAPYFSPFTHSIRSPYPNSFSRRATYCGENELRDLAKIIRAFRPTLIFTPHPKDAHPDHWATNAFVRAALETIAVESRPKRHRNNGASKATMPSPRLLTYLVHHGVYPAPKGLRRNAPLAPPSDLSKSNTLWMSFPLTPEEENKKEEAILKYRSQLPLLRKYLLSFVRRNELFGIFPENPPSVLQRQIRIDGLFDDWAGLPLTQPEPTADTVSLKAVGSADISGLTLARNKHYLFVRMDLRSPVARSVQYRLHLHAFPPSPDEFIPFKFDVFFRKPGSAKIRFHSPADTTFSPRVIRARSRGKSIEFRIPFYLLGNAEDFMIAAMTSVEGINMDRTSFLLVSLR